MRILVKKNQNPFFFFKNIFFFFFFSSFFFFSFFFFFSIFFLFFFPQFFFRGHAVNEKRKPFPSVCPSASVHNNNDQKYQNRPFFHFITPFYYRLRFRLPSRQRHRADYAIIKESIIFKGASGIYFLRYFHANYTEKSYKSQVY